MEPLTQSIRTNLLADGLILPQAVLKRSAVERNAAFIQAILARLGAVLCPHAKTHMSPQLVRLQLESGAWGMTAATPQQVLTLHDFGVKRILLANQLVGSAAVAAIVSRLCADPALEVLALADSLEGLRHLEDHLRRLSPPRPLDLLVEVGMVGGRAGCRTIEEAMAVAREAKASPHFNLRGVECYEGVPLGGSVAANEAQIATVLSLMVRAMEAFAGAGLFGPGPVIVSAGGSAHYDLAGAAMEQAAGSRSVVRVLRSGCYLTHDAGWVDGMLARMTERSPNLFAQLPPRPEAALEVWGYVLSRPEPDLAIVGVGKRDVSYDIELPRAALWARTGHASPLNLVGHQVSSLNDQHAYLSFAANSPLKIGDMVGFSISHPCTTFDKWRKIAVVDDDYCVTGEIDTFINDRLYL